MILIHFTDPSDKYSLCDVYSAGWQVDKESFNQSSLDTAHALVPLVSENYEYGLSMVLKLGDTSSSGKVAKTPMINLKVVIHTIGHFVFEVPQDIVNVNDQFTNCTGNFCKLSDFV